MFCRWSAQFCIEYKIKCKSSVVEWNLETVKAFWIELFILSNISVILLGVDD